MALDGLMEDLKKAEKMSPLNEKEELEKLLTQIKYVLEVNSRIYIKGKEHQFKIDFVDNKILCSLYPDGSFAPLLEKNVIKFFSGENLNNSEIYRIYTFFEESELDFGNFSV